MDYDLPSPSLDAVIYEQPLGSVQVLCQRVLGGLSQIADTADAGEGVGVGGDL